MCLSLDDNMLVREQVSFKVPMCKTGDVPYLVLGDIWNCDLGCPSTHICETIDFYNACCPLTIGTKDTVSTVPPGTVRSRSTVGTARFTVIVGTVSLSTDTVHSTSSGNISTVQSNGSTVIPRSTTSGQPRAPVSRFDNDKLPVVGPDNPEVVQLIPGTKPPPGVQSVQMYSQYLVWDVFIDVIF